MTLTLNICDKTGLSGLIQGGVMPQQAVTRGNRGHDLWRRDRPLDGLRAALWCFSGGSFQEFNLLNIGRGFSLIPRGGGVNSKTDSRDHGNFIFSKICLKGGDEVEF